MNHGNMADGDGDGAACKMMMLWNWYTIDACFLSASWHITNNGMFAATCVGVIMLTVAVEFMRRMGKEYDAFLLRQFHREHTKQLAVTDGTLSGPEVVKYRASVLQQLTRSFIHALTFGGAYMIMLLAMYFNGYIIICIFIGAGLGKFLCDWLVVKIDDGGRADSMKMPELKGIQEPSVCCG